MKRNTKSKFFHYKNLIIKIHPEVYEPAEDTFLMLESINVKPGEHVLEIGTGCGIIALECTSKGANVVCTDVNPYAVELAKYNYHKNKYFIKGKFEVRKGNLFSPIFENERFDVIIFNPPHLPTKKNELVGCSGWFDIAVNGGVEGLNLIKRFIKDLRKYLTDNGKAYFVFSSLSNRKKLHDYINKAGLNYQIVSSYNFNEESISVYCVY